MTYKVKSQFIKNKIKKKSFRNQKFRSNIDRLILLERAILVNNGYGWNFGSAQIVEMAKETYKKEFQEIFKELKPKEFQRYLEKKKKEKLKEMEENKRFCDFEKKENDRLKKEWLALGGKV